MPQAARVTDQHTCPQTSPLQPPSVGGSIAGPGEPTVLIEDKPAARVGDTCICNGQVDSIVEGEATVLIGGLPAARVGDKTAQGGIIVTGAGSVIIG